MHNRKREEDEADQDYACRNEQRVIEVRLPCHEITGRQRSGDLTHPEPRRQHRKALSSGALAPDREDECGGEVSQSDVHSSSGQFVSGWWLVVSLDGF